jgi:hypothetical protein
MDGRLCGRSHLTFFFPPFWDMSRQREMWDRWPTHEYTILAVHAHFLCSNHKTTRRKCFVTCSYIRIVSELSNCFQPDRMCAVCFYIWQSYFSSMVYDYARRDWRLERRVKPVHWISRALHMSCWGGIVIPTFSSVRPADNIKRP